MPLRLALLDKVREDRAGQDWKKPAGGYFDIRFIAKLVDKHLASPGIVRPDFRNTEGGVHRQFAERFMRGIDFNRNVGRWVDIEVDLAPSNNRVCVRANVKASVGFGPLP